MKIQRRPVTLGEIGGVGSDPASGDLALIPTGEVPRSRMAEEEEGHRKIAPTSTMDSNC